MRSSTPSIPTDRRISAGSTASAVSDTDMWVIAAGTSMRDSTPPSDSASVKSRVAWAIATALSAAVGDDPDAGLGIGLMPLHADMQRAQPTEHEEAVEWPGDATHRVLQEPQLLPDGVVRGDREAQDRVRVAGQVLGRGVEYHVGTERERSLDRR